MDIPGRTEQVEGTFVIGPLPGLRVEPGHGFEVVAKDVWLGIENCFQRRMIALQVGDQ